MAPMRSPSFAKPPSMSTGFFEGRSPVTCRCRTPPSSSCWSNLKTASELGLVVPQSILPAPTRSSSERREMTGLGRPELLTSDIAEGRGRVWTPAVPDLPGLDTQSGHLPVDGQRVRWSHAPVDQVDQVLE